MPKPVKILLIVLACGAGLAAILVGLVAIGILGEKELPVTASDRLLLASIDDVTPYFENFTPQIEAEKITKIRQLDGSMELALEYDPESDDQPYLGCTLDVERNAAAARSSFNIYWSATELGLKTQSASFQEVAGAFKHGDESRFAHVVRDGKIVGNCFSCRVDKKIYTFLLLGFYFEDPNQLKKILGPKLRQLNRYGTP